MDEKFSKRWESFQRSLDALAEARQRECTNPALCSAEQVQNSV